MSARKTQSALLHSVVPEACARHEMRWQALKAPCWLLYASSCRTAHRQELRDGWEAESLQMNAGSLDGIVSQNRMTHAALHFTAARLQPEMFCTAAVSSLRIYYQTCL